MAAESNGVPAPARDPRQGGRRLGRRAGLRLALLAPAALVLVRAADVSAGTLADKGDGKGSGRGKGRGRAGAPPAAVVPASKAPDATDASDDSAGPSEAAVTARGTEQMVSDGVRLHGVDGSGAGPVRIDLAGAAPLSVYEVEYVAGAGPAQPVSLGTVKTDARGSYTGVAPRHMPPVDAVARTGVLVLRRLPPA